MDEAFVGIGDLLAGMLAFGDELVDEASGARMYLTAYDIATPIELDVTRDEAGQVRIGMAPPLYRVETSLRPSFHDVRFRAELGGDDG
jgi:hypothetical protein